MNQHDDKPAEQRVEAPYAGPSGGESVPGVADGTAPAEPSSGQDESGAAADAAAASPGTGDDRVDAALSRLAELDRLDVTEHAGVVEDVHRALQDTLAEEED